jgi:arylsulfatase
MANPVSRSGSTSGANPFDGRVGRTFAGSEPSWTPRPRPDGAPNVVIMLVDDLGWSDLGCFGGEIDTPNLDALAASGLRYTNFHVAAMCSPTRAALLTGVNPHRAGMGSVAQSDPGFPGYASELPVDVATTAELLRDAGYATCMVGKWHLCKDSDEHAAGPHHSWPCQRGFDRFYGFLGPFTNLHHPAELVRDNTPIDIDEYPDGYYLTDDLTDQAISMIRSVKVADPDKPFFLYFAHGAVHAPLHAKPADIAKYADAYRAGWDAIRASRYERQHELGILPEGAQLPPRNSEAGDDVLGWDALTDDERELFARHMSVYAAMVDNIDQNVGRLLHALGELDALDNTILLFMSDNGASREGEAVGTSAYYVHLLQGDDVQADLARIDLLGGPQTTPHYPRGWAMASGTPWRLYKINMHAGGHTSPVIVSWPDGKLDGGALRRQYVYVTDVLPTLLDLLGVERPSSYRGTPLQPLAGMSFAPTLRDPGAVHTHVEQYAEMNGHRGYYRDGLEIVTNHRPLTPFGDHEWELYDLRSDPTELRDLAAAQPALVAELAAAWESAARDNDVYPLDEGSSLRFLLRPDWVEAFRKPVTIPRGTPTLERWRSVQLIWFRSCAIRVALDHAAGARGYLVAHGDQGSGYGVYVLDDEVVFVHNDGRGHVRHLSGGELRAGTKEVVLRLDAVPQRRWNATLTVDGAARGELDDVPMLFGIAPFEGIDVGIDRRSPVSWEIYERFGSFSYTGALQHARYEPGDPGPDSPDRLIDIIRSMGAKFE